jgi:hypothetical protein
MTCELKAGTGEFTLPEVSEANAPDSVQAICRDIRRLSGVPMVALIFRHIATYPDILEKSGRRLVLCSE